MILALLLALPAAAAPTASEAALAGFSPASAGPEAADLLRPLLPAVRAAEADLALRADRWEAPLALEPVEAMLAAPLSVPERAGELSDGADTLSAALRSAARGAGLPEARPSAAGGGTEPPAAVKDRGLRRALRSLSAAVEAAARGAAARAGSWSAEDKELVLGVMGALARSESGEGGEEGAFALAAASAPAGWPEEAEALARAAEEALPELARAAFSGRLRWRTPAGDVLLAGPGDDVYTDADLDGTALLVDLGGRSRYAAGPAAASAGQVRVVVDLSPEIAVETAAGGLGSGVFGVGLFYAPAPGTKTVRCGDLALGAGLFGAGGAFVAGPLRAESGRLAMGAAAFGTGALVVAGGGSQLSSGLASQGYGFTGGSGLFVLRGDGSRAECGLRRPDPREPKAYLSLCQGAGHGPRAFAAGGVGTAVVEGSSNSLRASYMAQGTGYWHGLGRLLLRGGGNRLQGRRYVQGAGVHTALGLLSVRGDGNEARSWGVGPAFGWDYGAGWLSVEGSSNALAAEWAAGRGDVNGHGFAAVRGDGNRLALAGAAAGAMRRNAPSYGLAAARGSGNVLRAPDPDPWGAAAGFAFDAALAAPAADWPEAPRGAHEEADARRVLHRMLRAETLPPEERARAWLSALADSGLEARVPLAVAERLLQDPEQLELLPAAVTAERFDEMVWARLLLSGGGRRASRAAAREAAAASGQRKAVLASLLSVFGDAAADAALGLLADPDWRVRRAAALSAGALLSREAGEEPGRLALLAAADAACGRPADESLFARLGAQKLGAYLQVLAVDAEAPRGDLARVFRAAGGAVLDRLHPGHAAAREFAAVLAGRGPERCAALRRALAASEALLPRAREALRSLLDDPEPEAAQAALTALAQIGDADDAGFLAARLDAPSALLREAAAAGLGRMGIAGVGGVHEAMNSTSPLRRSLAALAAAQSSEPDVFKLLGTLLDDPEPAVRAAAVAGLFAVQEPLRPRRKDFLPALRRLAETDPAAARAAAALGP